MGNKTLMVLLPLVSWIFKNQLSRIQYSHVSWAYTLNFVLCTVHARAGFLEIVILIAKIYIPRRDPRGWWWVYTGGRWGGKTRSRNFFQFFFSNLIFLVGVESLTWVEWAYLSFFWYFFRFFGRGQEPDRSTMGRFLCFFGIFFFAFYRISNVFY